MKKILSSFLVVLALVMVAVPAMSYEYVVKAGDNPAKIAKELNISVGEVMTQAGITDPRKLRVGTKIMVPEPEVASVVEALSVAANEVIAQSENFRVYAFTAGIAAEEAESENFQIHPPAYEPKSKTTESKGSHSSELISGGGLWTNEVAEGNFLYAEGLYRPDGWGIGAYTMKESGESKISDYKWSGWLAGPQVGFVHYELGQDGLPEQWQLKLRFVYESLRGNNSESDYEMTQQDVKLGAYYDYVNQLSSGWKGIVVAEGWLTLWKERESSWKGDQAENRDQASLGLYGQWNQNKDFGIRFGGGPFYQGWDKMIGLTGRLEFRLAETVMMGGYVSYPLNIPDQYKAMDADKADLTTMGAFVRIEF
jgi:LysM repeat protein